MVHNSINIVKVSASDSILVQPWAIQIGSRAKLLLKCHVEGQHINFYYPISRFFYEIAIFQKFLKGRRLPMAVLVYPFFIDFSENGILHCELHGLQDL
jgi:hypothetical protein